MFLLKYSLINNIKRNIYIAATIEIICLLSMYYFTQYQNVNIFIGLFIIHQLLTPYIMFNLDTLFESYTHISERGRSRGIYLTAWNIPFVVVPILTSTLSVSELPIVYFISSLLLLPFLFLIFYHIKNPEIFIDTSNNLIQKLKSFFKDKLDRKSFIVQSSLHLYYAFLAIMLPIYLHSVFLFDWNRIGLILAAMTSPFILTQIYFGKMEDRKHNEKSLFRIGILIAVFFIILVLMISPEARPETSFILFCVFLFLSHTGCSLIEISTEGMFYKHVTARDHTALLMFRMGRILPYTLGLLALFWVY
jgi:nitrate/nitrite transporter NarK